MLGPAAANGKRDFTFNAHDERHMSSLPSAVRNMFPVMLHGQAAITKEALDISMGMLMGGACTATGHALHRLAWHAIPALVASVGEA